MKMMVGYDGSNASREVLQVAEIHAKAFNAEVHVVHSLTGGRDSNQSEIEAATKELQWVDNFLQEASIPCETHLLIRGMTPGEDLVAFAEKKE